MVFLFNILSLLKLAMEIMITQRDNMSKGIISIFKMKKEGNIINRVRITKDNGHLRAMDIQKGDQIIDTLIRNLREC